MAIGDSYNVILPFTTSNAIVPSTIVTGQLTVTGDLNATRYVALNLGSSSTPAFSFSATGTNAGMFATATTINFTIGTQVAYFSHAAFNGGATVPYIAIGSGNNLGFLTFTTAPTTTFLFYNGTFTTLGNFGFSQLRMQAITGFGGVVDSTQTRGFVLDTVNNPAILHTNIPGTYAATWVFAEGGAYYSRGGILQSATTSVLPSTTRSGAHATNLISGVTTVFFTLPTSVPGLFYTVSQANSAANTVVISPVAAADTINVFGLAKAAGASVAANAPFSSITLHCITSTQWLATDILGTWS